jgi:hypothetical protein
MDCSNNSTITAASDAGKDGMNNPIAIDIAGDLATQALIEDLENQYVSLKCDRDKLQLEIEDARLKIVETAQKVSYQHDLELQLQKYKNELALSASQLDAIKEKRKLELEKLDRQSLESDSLREELR